MVEWRVALCASAYDGLKAPLVKTLLNLGLALGERKDIKYLPLLVPALHGTTALNGAIRLAQEAIDAADVREPLTHIVWMDRDIMLTGDQVLRLLTAVDPWHPAVFALARDPKCAWAPNIWRFDGPIPRAERLRDWPVDALVRVGSAGTAAAAFDAELFDSLKEPWFRWEVPAWGGDGNPNVCRQLLAQGIPVYCHTGVKPRQVGSPPLFDPGEGVWT